MNGPRVLVTGASGFLGSHVVRIARAQECDVLEASRNSSRAGAVVLDLCDRHSVDAAFRAVLPSIVIHCAAYGVDYADQDFERALQVNVRGSLHVLEAAARFDVRRMVHVGSAVEYGSHAGPIIEDASLHPTALYGSTKAAATILVRERARALGVSVLVVRPFALWGPGEGMHHLIPQVVAACASRSPLQLTSCEVLRDYTYVEDIAGDILALALADRDLSGAIVNLGSGEAVRLRDFVLAVAKLLGGAELMHFGALPDRPTEIRSLVADLTRVQRILGVRRRTDLSEGVRRMTA